MVGGDVRVRVILAAMFLFVFTSSWFLPEKIARPIIDFISNPFKIFWVVSQCAFLMIMLQFLFAKI